jgi:hypothetical protein
MMALYCAFSAGSTAILAVSYAVLVWTSGMENSLQDIFRASGSRELVSEGVAVGRTGWRSELRGWLKTDYRRASSSFVIRFEQRQRL